MEKELELKSVYLDSHFQLSVFFDSDAEAFTPSLYQNRDCYPLPKNINVSPSVALCYSRTASVRKNNLRIQDGFNEDIAADAVM